MSKIVWNNAKFISSAKWPSEYPTICSSKGTALPHIALAGRSNVGKSSLINALCGTRQLVKVSSTPGKTQTLNFFCISDSFFFVDLPGYGYAKCPQAIKKEWDKMITTFLEQSSGLSLLLFLLDMRRVPNEDDLQLLKWASWHQKPIALVFTKVDKVSKSEKELHTKKVMEALPYDNLTYLHHSSHTRIGTLELRKLIEGVLAS